MIGIAYQITGASGQSQCSPGPSISKSDVACLYVCSGATESSCCQLLTSYLVLLDDCTLSDCAELASGLLLRVLKLYILDISSGTIRSYLSTKARHAYI